MPSPTNSPKEDNILVRVGFLFLWLVSTVAGIFNLLLYFTDDDKLLASQEGKTAFILLVVALASFVIYTIISKSED